MAKGEKTGGRDKGTPNRLTNELRKVFKDVIAKEIDNIPELMEKLEPKDRLELLIKLIPYVLPKVEPVHSTEGEPLTFEW